MSAIPIQTGFQGFSDQLIKSLPAQWNPAVVGGEFKYIMALFWSIVFVRLLFPSSRYHFAYYFIQTLKSAVCLKQVMLPVFFFISHIIIYNYWNYWSHNTQKLYLNNYLNLLKFNHDINISTPYPLLVLMIWYKILSSAIAEFFQLIFQFAFMYAKHNWSMILDIWMYIIHYIINV